MTDRGFTLVEALVATLLTLGVMGAALSFVAPDSYIAQSRPEAMDVQQRARVVADLISRDLFMAGAGPSAGPQTGPLVRYLPPVLPRRVGRTGADPHTTARPDRITLVYLPVYAAQTTLHSALPAGAGSIDVDLRPSCPIGRAACGLEEGMSTVVFDDGGNFDFFKVTDVATPLAGVRHLASSASQAYREGVSIAQAELHTYYFDPAARQLRHYDGDGSDVPVADHVVSVQFEYWGDPAPPRFPKPAAGSANCLYDAAGAPVSGLAWLPTDGASLAPLPLPMLQDGPWCGGGSTVFDADLLRIGRVRITLRIEASLTGLRGLGVDFANPGTSRHPLRTVPDYSVTFDVSPRNLSLGR